MDKTTSRITIVIDKEIKKKVVLYCTEKEITVKEFITNILKERFEK